MEKKLVNINDFSLIIKQNHILYIIIQNIITVSYN